MITTFLALIGGAAGGIMRLIPEILKIWSAKSDQAHELAMTQMQLQIDSARSAQGIDLVHAQSQAAESSGELTAYVEAIKGQGQLSGVRWVDGFNTLVRPMLTTWWMLLFTAFKIDQLMREGLSWGDNDWTVLSMILSFWFVDRAIRVQRPT